MLGILVYRSYLLCFYFIIFVVTKKFVLIFSFDLLHFFIGSTQLYLANSPGLLLCSGVEEGCYKDWSLDILVARKV